MKVAFYGNNLNAGYFFVQALIRLGVEARLFCIDYPTQQEHHGWWTSKEIDSSAVTLCPVTSEPLGGDRKLESYPEIAAIYDEVRTFDLLIVTEYGPALFSELEGIKKVFFSFGSDLQVYPFLRRVYHPTGALLKEAIRAIGRRIRGDLSAIRDFQSRISLARTDYRFQQRQRKGIRQCAAVNCTGQQTELTRELGIENGRVHYLPVLPMNREWLSEWDEAKARELEDKYRDVDIVFLHPTRQFYLSLNGDTFLKDNDKLLYAFARFVKDTRKRVRLLLIRKGRPEDIQNSEALIDRLGIAGSTEWLPEMPNRELRAYYTLRQVVLCDQYSPNIAILGNTGREATYFGRPIITAFAEWNRRSFGDDLPPHVFAAQNANQIASAMEKIEAMDDGKKEEVRKAAIEWFGRNLDEESLMPRYVEFLTGV